MIISAMQPYYFPAIHYFQLIASSDIFILLDDVNYINKGFIHKNFFFDELQIKRKVFLLKLKKKSQNKLINEIELIDYESSLNLIKNNYRNNRFFQKEFQLICKKLDDNKDKKLIDL